MGSNVPLFPEAASSGALRVDQLFWAWLVMAAFFTLLIFTLLLVLSIKYRRRLGHPTGEPVTGVTLQADEVPPRPRPELALALEIAWTAIPLVIVMALFVWGASVYFHLVRPPADAMTVNVVGKRWMWKLQHPSGKREINELHVPLGRAVKLRLTSEDVIHSFYVPAFRVKQDVVPGRYQQLWFRPVKTGRFHLFCAEYCGTDHSGMIGSVVVMEPSEFQKWLASEAGSASGGSVSPAVAGAELYTKLACATCHRNPGPGEPPSLGPSLEDAFGSTIALADGRSAVVDEDFVRRSLLDPMADVAAGYPPVMPTFKGQVDEEQLMALIEYLKSLGGRAP